MFKDSNYNYYFYLFIYFYSLEGWCGITVINSTKISEAVMVREEISVIEH